GYASTAPRDLDVDVLLRTGVEGAAALRLSGLCSHPGIVNCGLTTLWPDVTTDDVDAVIDAAKARPKPGFAPGYGPAAAAAIARAVAAARPGVRASLPSHAPPDALAEAFREAFGPPSARGRPPAVEIVGAAGAAPLPFGAAADGPRLRVLAGGARLPASGGDAFAAVLAPGQRGPMLALPEWDYGYATIHACEATPAGIVDGLCAAERFARTHVALRGAERFARPRATPRDAERDAPPADPRRDALPADPRRAATPAGPRRDAAAAGPRRNALPAGPRRDAAPTGPLTEGALR
ncbi:MAG TPA: hypothetical protein VFS00_07795, partial [Polyangiaceae bacterium]|nr:hypothetical protein [Polyangiaceae bacterium]